MQIERWLDGYWVVNGNSLVRHLLAKCVRCRILRGKADNPKMAILPSDPLQPSLFTYCGVDLFGPFIIKERRSELKCYGVMCTFLNSREVHLESVSTIETDSFIMSLRSSLSLKELRKLTKFSEGRRPEN